MPTQQIDTIIPSNCKSSGNYDIPKQKMSANSNETEKDDDIYLLATQPINTDSQFKVPKSFTFKKKPVAILEKSLNTLLGDNDKDDDIFDVATQKITDPVEVQKSSDDTEKIENVFEEPTQPLIRPTKTQDFVDTDANDDIYLQPTQCIEPSTDNVQNAAIKS